MKKLAPEFEQRGSALEETFAGQLFIHGVPPPIREFPFATNGRKWRFDFAWLEERLAVEIEGGTRSNGRHSRHAGFTEDCVKYNYATANGWRVFRFTSEMVNDGRAVNQVSDFFKEISTLKF